MGGGEAESGKAILDAGIGEACTPPKHMNTALSARGDKHGRAGVASTLAGMGVVQNRIHEQQADCFSDHGARLAPTQPDA